MAAYEAAGETDEWFTPRYIFDALGLRFNLDVAAPPGGPRHVPADAWLTPEQDGLMHPWDIASAFRIDGDLLTPCSASEVKNALAAGEFFRRIPIISACGQIVQAGLPLDAGSVLAITALLREHGNMRGVLVASQIRLLNAAHCAEAISQQLSSSFLHAQTAQTALPLDAGIATAALPERGMLGSEPAQKEALVCKRKRPSTLSPTLAERGSANAAESITHEGASAASMRHLTGMLEDGGRCCASSTTAVPTAERTAGFTKTTSSRSPAKLALEPCRAISSPPAPSAILAREAEIRIPGLQTLLASHGFSDASGIIVAYCRPLTWMNPPFGHMRHKRAWLGKFFAHGNGIALVPDRTSAPWFQEFAPLADAICWVAPKIKFERPDGSRGESPGTGTALLAAGTVAAAALDRCGLGMVTGRRIAA